MMETTKPVGFIDDNQLAVFNAGPQPTLHLGGVGSGKTMVGCMKMLYLMDEYPGSHGAIVRQQGKQLRSTTMQTFFKLCPPSAIARRNDNEGIVELKNGSWMKMMGLDKPDSMNSLKSLELNFAYVDQAEDISAEAWDTLTERLGRWTGAMKRGGYPKGWAHHDDYGTPLPPTYLFASAYSPGYDHWLTARFWEYGLERDRYRAQGYQVIHSSTRANRFLPTAYVQGRLAMGPEYVRRFVDATDWGASEGNIFNLDDKSIVEPTGGLLDQINRLMKRHRVYDHGDYSPFACGWFATDAYGNIFMYGELMKREPLIYQQRQDIYDLSNILDHGEMRYTSQLADPVIFDKTRGKTAQNIALWSIADEWNDKQSMDPRTTVWWRPADNNEEATRARLQEFLRVDPNHRHPITGELGAPRIYFIKRTLDYPHGCHDVITDIRSARRVRLPGQNPDGSAIYSDERDDKVRDHLLDTVRYFCVSRPPIGRTDMPEPPPPGTLRLKDYERMCEENRLNRARDERIKMPYGRYGY